MPRALPLSSVCFVIFAGTLSPTLAHAFPTSAPLEGPTGLGIVPTTDTVGARQFQLGLGYERINTNGGSVRFAPVVTGTAGFRRGEFGLGLHHERASFGAFNQSSRFLAAHAKYRVIDNTRSGAALAVGGHYLDFRGGGHVSTLYAVGSYPILAARKNANGADSGAQTGEINIARLRGHLGLMRQMVGLPGARDLTRPFAGLDFTPARGVTLAADYLLRDGTAPRQASLVARYETASRIGGQIGLARLGSDSKVFAGLVYGFGKRGAR